ncbi:MAG: TetR/AcrR family transcriptional regulator [Cellvibrionaceae bacterium]|nr:TetR/AcrR family transcriptional regulator [Cellvibrionaceae bacterium]
MARPAEFNREDVVQKSLIVFRQKGYKGASMRDLEAVTGLNPGSFYAAFGNKHHFFIETLRYFYQKVQLSFTDSLSRHANPIMGLRAFFDSVIECVESNEKAERCCYMIKSALEMAATDEQVAQLMNAHFAEMEHIIYEALAQAQQQTLIRQHRDLSVLSKLLINTLYGINVEGMLEPDKHKLQQMIALLFNELFDLQPEVATQLNH